VNQNPEEIRRPAQKLVGSIEDLLDDSGGFFVGDAAQSLGHIGDWWKVIDKR